MNTYSVCRTWAIGLVAVLLSAAAASAAVKKGPVQVFILAGQSNMDGQAEASTIDFLGEDKDPQRAAMLKTFKPDGKTFVTRDDVWVSNPGVYDKLQPGFGGRKNYDKLGTKIGPEYSFGYYMGQALDHQVLLIKYGPGGQSLKVNFRPPSAGKVGEKVDDEEYDKKTVDTYFDGKPQKIVGAQYRKLLDIVHETLANLKTHFPDYDEKAGYKIEGLVWFQGYNDLGDTEEEYSKDLVCLINDLRKDLNAPDMKVVVGVIGVNGVNNEGGKQKALRDAQRSINAMPQFKGNARAIESAPLCSPEVVELKTMGWLNKRDAKTNPVTPQEQALLRRATSNMGFHYYGEGRFFILLGKAMSDTMLDLMGMENKVVAPRLNTFKPPTEGAQGS